MRCDSPTQQRAVNETPANSQGGRTAPSSAGRSEHLLPIWRCGISTQRNENKREMFSKFTPRFAMLEMMRMLCATTLAKKIETGTQAKRRRVHARQITRLCHVHAVVSIFLARVVKLKRLAKDEAPG